jgi:hypothetical protein
VAFNTNRLSNMAILEKATAAIVSAIIEPEPIINDF